MDPKKVETCPRAPSLQVSELRSRSGEFGSKVQALKEHIVLLVTIF